MTEKTLTTENIKPALDALRGELAPWPVVAMKQDRLNDTQKSAVNSGITSSLVAQIIANTAAIRALESAITGTGLRALVVSSLPAIGTQGILYIVPVTTYDPATDADVVNYSNEYIWIPVEGGTASEGHYEQVGQTGIVINNGQLTITVNGTSVGTFTANQSGDTTAAITVPTNADYVDRTTDQTVAGVKTFSSTINGTASKAIADEDGTSIKTGYGKLAGSQTWTGSNTFTSTLTTKTNVDRTVAPASDTTYGTVICRDKNNSAMFRMQGTIKTDLSNVWDMMMVAPNNSYITFFKYTISSSSSDRELRFKVTSVVPDDNSTADLGTSSYRWSSVYADSYYYGTTAWGLDKANTWTNVNTFSIATAESIAVKHTTYKGAILFRTNGVSAFKNYNTFLKWDINGYDNTFGLYRSVGVLGDTTTGATDEDIDTSFSLWKAHIRSKSLDFTDSVKVTNDGTENSLKPITNNATDLGTSTNQWKSVYSQTYYYNGVAWGLDKANVWSGENTYTNTYLTQKQTGLEEGELPTSNQTRRFRFTDKNNASLGWLQHRINTSGDSALELLVVNKFSNGQLSTQGSEVLNSVVVGLHGDGSRFLTTLGDIYPDLPTRVCNLGTSTNKWKTLNGINPGALSLPSSSYIEIDTTNWDKTGATSQSYTPTVHGWLYISIQNIAGNYLSMSGGRGAISMDGTGVQSGLRAMLPVIANESVSITVKTGFIFAARFYPMLGNV